MTPQTRWLLTADERHARLCSCERSAGGQWHVTQQASLENRWEDYHEHHRPNALDGRPSTSRGKHSTSGFSEMEEHEESRRFARDVRHWLETAMNKSSVEHLVIFAASRFLAPLRHELLPLSNRVVFFEGELAQISPSDLGNHPAIIRSLQEHGAAS